jgi:hypothetical protein
MLYCPLVVPQFVVIISQVVIFVFHVVGWHPKNTR